MRSLLDRNLAALSGTNPALADRVREAETPDGVAILPTRSGQATLIVDGVSLHSRFDPWAEAEALADKILSGQSQAAVFGLGLGYHALAMLRRLDRLWVVEPRPWMIRLALSRLDFKEAAGRLVFLTQPPDADGCPALSLPPHPPSARLDPEAYRDWARRLARVETAGELETACARVDGISGLLVNFPRRAEVPLTDLTHEARSRRGPMNEAEILVLLLDEFSRESAAGPSAPS